MIIVEKLHKKIDTLNNNDVNKVYLYVIHLNEMENLNFNKETLMAFEEGRRIINDDSVKGYDNMDDLRKSLETS